MTPDEPWYELNGKTTLRVISRAFLVIHMYWLPRQLTHRMKIHVPHPCYVVTMVGHFPDCDILYQILLTLACLSVKKTPSS